MTCGTAPLNAAFDSPRSNFRLPVPKSWSYSHGIERCFDHAAGCTDLRHFDLVGAAPAQLHRRDLSDYRRCDRIMAALPALSARARCRNPDIAANTPVSTATCFTQGGMSAGFFWPASIRALTFATSDLRFRLFAIAALEFVHPDSTPRLW